MSIFHVVDSFTMIPCGSHVLTFVILFIGAPSNCEVASGVNIELKKLANIPTPTKGMLSRTIVISIQREIWKSMFFSVMAVQLP